MKFIPHKYQTYAMTFIKEHPQAMMLLDMGLGLARLQFHYTESWI